MRCGKPGGAPGHELQIPPGTRVQEGDTLLFTATPPTGQEVDAWKIGTKELPVTGRWFRYTVRAQDAENGWLTIDYTVKPAAQVTIHFDSGKITCCNYFNFNDTSPVHNNDTVYEDDLLVFKATLQSGQLFNKWTVNGVEREFETSNECFNYLVEAWDVQSGSVTIGYTLK